MILTGIILAFVIIQNTYLLINNTGKYKPWLPIFNILAGLTFSIIGILYYWDAHRPKTGPVGNGPNHGLLITNFLIMLVGGVCFIILGFIGVYIKRKFYTKPIVRELPNPVAHSY
ncbi:MAG: hypothetical protein K0R75_1913 [Paenibacillaceae bacterium]|jgi:hypothetical protein|nr:hypothetical protein [Paenibacillaceae bacterium]